MDSRAVQVGDLVRIAYEEYWKRKQTSEVEGSMLAHHVAWGLSPINKYHQTTDTYEFMVMDPHVYMLKCIEYGW